MRATSAFIIIPVASFVLVSCSPQQPDATALRKTVEEYNAASMEAMKSGNTDKVMPYYEDGAMEMPPNMDMVKGKDGIRAFMDQMTKSGMKVTDVRFETIETEAGGKIAYEVGSYEMSITVPGTGDMKDKGKYVCVWRQQQDGSWKVHAEIWNSDMPKPDMEQTAKKEDKKKK